MRQTLLIALLCLAACAQRPEESRWPADIRQTYDSTTAYADDEVRAGRMTEAQAKMVKARARQSAIDAAASRDSDPVADYLILRRMIR